jgi:TPR repeat protein
MEIPMPKYAAILCCVFLLTVLTQAGNVQAAESKLPSSLTPPPQPQKTSNFFPTLPDKATESKPPTQWMHPSSSQVQSGNTQTAEQVPSNLPVIQNNLVAIQKSAERGDARSQFRLGLMYEFGIGVVENKKMAATWYGKAAKQEHGRAQEMLSKLAQTERDIRQNEAEFNKQTDTSTHFRKYPNTFKESKDNQGALPMTKTSPGHM